jgi:hypothetical protein
MRHKSRSNIRSANDWDSSADTGRVAALAAHRRARKRRRPNRRRHSGGIARLHREHGDGGRQARTQESHWRSDADRCQSRAGRINWSRCFRSSVRAASLTHSHMQSARSWAVTMARLPCCDGKASRGKGILPDEPQRVSASGRGRSGGRGAGRLAILAWISEHFRSVP